MGVRHVLDLAAATLSVRADRLEAVALVYRETFGYEIKWSGPSPWSRESIVLGAPGEERGLVRLVESDAPPPPPLSTYGWSALEITVRDVDALHCQLVKHPAFRVNGEPKDLLF